MNDQYGTMAARSARAANGPADSPVEPAADSRAKDPADSPVEPAADSRAKDPADSAAEPAADSRAEIPAGSAAKTPVDSRAEPAADGATETPADGAATVTQLELALLHPANRANPDFVRSVLHPDFYEFGSSGRVWDVDSITAALAADPSADPDAAIDFAAIHLSPNAILLTYRTANALRSSIWVRDPEGRWRVRFHQGTPASRTLGGGPAGTV